MVLVDLRGRKRRGRHNPTSELDLHLRILTRRPDVGAVVHAHPPVATGLAVAGQDLHILVLPELILQCGDVPLVPYGTPGTPELGDRLRPHLARDGALVVAHHRAGGGRDPGERAGARARGLRGPARGGDGGAQGPRRERPAGDPGKAVYARRAAEKGGARRREADRDRAAPFSRRVRRIAMGTGASGRP